MEDLDDVHLPVALVDAERARQRAIHNEPEGAPERNHWYELAWRIDEKKAEIERCSQPQNLPSERFVQKQELSDLRNELAELEAQFKAPYSAQATATPASVSGKKWIPEKLAELAAYRAAHTMPETAANFGISEQRIRDLLPSKKPKAKPFAGLIHRIN